MRKPQHTHKEWEVIRDVLGAEDATRYGEALPTIPEIRAAFTKCAQEYFRRAASLNKDLATGLNPEQQKGRVVRAALDETRDNWAREAIQATLKGLGLSDITRTLKGEDRYELYEYILTDYIKYKSTGTMQSSLTACEVTHQDGRVVLERKQSELPFDYAKLEAHMPARTRQLKLNPVAPAPAG